MNIYKELKKKQDEWFQAGMCGSLSSGEQESFDEQIAEHDVDAMLRKAVMFATRDDAIHAISNIESRYRAVVKSMIEARSDHFVSEIIEARKAKAEEHKADRAIERARSAA